MLRGGVHIALWLEMLIIGMFLQPLHAQSWSWSVSPNGPGSLEHLGIAVDDLGNTLVTGYFSDNIDFGNGIVRASTNASQDIFVAKYDPSGLLIWAISAGESGDDTGLDIALDGAGYAYVTGNYKDSLNFAGIGGPLTVYAQGEMEMFVVKLSLTTGLATWISSSNGSIHASGQAIAVDSNGVYVTGFLDGNCNFGGNTLAASGLKDAVVARINRTNGNWDWAVSGGSLLDDVGYGICTDGNAVYITGTFGNGTFTFGSTTLSPTGMQDAFVLKLNANGTSIWSSAIGGMNGDEFGEDLVTDSLSLIVAGNTSAPGTLIFRGTPSIVVNSAAALGNFWLANLDPLTGNATWAKMEGGQGEDQVYGIALMTGNDFVVTGSFTQSIVLGPDTLTTNFESPYLYILDRNTGTGQTAEGPTGTGMASGQDVCSYHNCELIVTGSYDQSLTFPNLPTLTATGPVAGFTARYQLGGNGSGVILSPTMATICAGDSIKLFLTGAFTQANWLSSTDGGATWTQLPYNNFNVVNVIPTTSTIYVTNTTNACNTSHDTAWVTVVPPPSPAIVGLPDSVCFTDTPIAFSVTPNFPLGTFQLSQPGFINLGNGNLQFDPNLAGAGGVCAIQYDYVDTWGCKASVSDSVRVIAPVSLTLLGLDSTYCAGDASAPLIGNMSPLGLISSSCNCVGSATNGSALFSPAIAPVNAAISVQYSYFNGCNNQITVQTVVYPKPNPLVSGLDSTYCIGTLADTIQGLMGAVGTFSGGTWLTQLGTNAAVLNPSAIPAIDTVRQILYSVTDSHGCAADTLFSTHCLLSPMPDAGVDDTICAGAVDTIGTPAVNGWAYFWTSNPQGSTSNTAIWSIAPTTNTDFFLEVIAGNGCRGRDTVQVMIRMAAQADAGPDTLLCQGDSIVLGGNLPANLVYAWTSDHFFTSNLAHPTIVVDSNEKFLLVVADSAGYCTASDILNLNVVNPLPIVDAGPDQFLYAAQTVMDATPASTTMGSWSSFDLGLEILDPHDPQSTVHGLAPGNYTLLWTVTNAPCPAQKDSLVIHVAAMGYPTGFSPNGDGDNDVLVFRGLEFSPHNRLLVYNRWGNLVYSMDGYDNAWNGTQNGEPLVDDTYFYVLEVEGKSPVNNYLVLKRE